MGTCLMLPLAACVCAPFSRRYLLHCLCIACHLLAPRDRSGAEADELQDVPGIGSKSAEALATHGISTIQQLVGAYMGFVEPNAESNEINNKFYKWFKEKSPNANGHTVTFAIAHLADKYGIVLYEN